MISIFNPPKLTGSRMTVAMLTALTVDAVQLIIGPLGFFSPLDDLLDLVAGAVIMMSVGFHPLLLPTFLAELVPVVDMIPTWTGCTLAVLALRRKTDAPAPTSPPPVPNPDHMKRATVVEEPRP